jgi:hypothetical protein
MKGAAFLRRHWDSLGLLLLTGALLAASLPLSRLAGWIPRTVLATTLLLLILQLVLALRAPANRPGKTMPAADPGVTDIEPAIPQETRSTVPASPVPESCGISPLHAIAWVAALPLAILLLGVTVGAALFCVAYLRWHAAENWRVSSLFAVALGAAMQLVFGTLFQAGLYPGWFWMLWQNL